MRAAAESKKMNIGRFEIHNSWYQRGNLLPLWSSLIPYFVQHMWGDERFELRAYSNLFPVNTERHGYYTDYLGLVKLDPMCEITETIFVDKTQIVEEKQEVTRVGWDFWEAREIVVTKNQTFDGWKRLDRNY